MKIRTSEIIAGFVTTIVFIVVFSYLFDIPNALPEISTVSEWIEKFSTKEEPQTKKKPEIRSSGIKNAKIIDTFNGVDIYYNGNVSNVQGRHLTDDGYNLGLKYQCVEFVKRYYYEYYNHKMPNSYGNAKDFFDHNLADGTYNKGRDLIQYRNNSSTKPSVGDLVVFGPTQWNQFGHVAIISKVKRDKIEIAQQNPGSNNPSREWYDLIEKNGMYRVSNPYVFGWLRKA